MKNALTRTIIVCVAVNLMTTVFALAKNAPDEKTQEVIEKEDTLGAITTALEELMMATPVPSVAQKEEVARRHMESEMMMQLPVAPRLSRRGLQYSGSGAVLVVPTAEMKTEDLAAITEDMTVMSRIFDKKLSQTQLITGAGGSRFVGIDPRSFLFDPQSFGRSSGSIEAIYLDGYGALFLMKVN